MVTITRATAPASAQFAVDASATAHAAPEWAHPGQSHAHPESHPSLAEDRRGALAKEIHDKQNEVERLAGELKNSGDSSWAGLVGAFFGADSGAAGATPTPVSTVRASVDQPTDQPQVHGPMASGRLYAKPDWPGPRPG